VLSPRRNIFLSALAAGVLASCGAIPDPDLVASVDDAVLNESEFDDFVRELTGNDELTEIDGDTARQVVGTFVGTEVLRADLAAMDVEPTGVPGDLAGFVEVQTDFQILAQTWQTLPAATTLDETSVALYEGGPDASGLVCAAHILVDSRDEADEVVDRLESGEEFAPLAAEVSTDPGSAASGGSLGCLPTGQFEVQFIPEFVDAALAAEVGIPTPPVESEFGWHVIQLVPADQLGDQDAIALRLATFDERYDIVINPRFGRWDPNTIIAPTT
jgi:parvulin-like peptidyl-prolyl isomerase